MESKDVKKCRECSMEFRINKGCYYDRVNKNYLCKNCGKDLPVDDKIVPLLKQQSLKAFFTKIIVAAFLVYCSIYSKSGTDDKGADIVFIISALVCVASAVIPYIKRGIYLSKLKDFTAQQKKEMKLRKTICMNCGAPSSGDNCEYCGSPLKK